MSDRPAALARPCLVRAADHAAVPGGYQFSHPFNPASLVQGLPLSRATGLARTAVTLFRVPPGHDSFAYHCHYAEEEWVYVLAGRGVAVLDGVEHEVGPGDFMGFPTPSIAHLLKNPYADELVYLAGGEIRACEVADFPHAGKRIVRAGDALAVHELADATGFGPFPALTPPR